MEPLACNGCTKCCDGGEIELLTRGDPRLKGAKPDVLKHYRTKRRGSRHFLERRPDGLCVYLTDTGCSTQDRKPHICRVFDCREYALIVERMKPEMQPARLRKPSVQEGIRRLAERGITLTFAGAAYG